jgi:hypothetical protein
MSQQRAEAFADVPLQGAPVREAPEPPPVDEAWLDAMDAALANEPDATLMRVRATMGRQMTEPELRRLMASVRVALRRPDVAHDWLSERLAADLGPTTLPEDFKANFDGWEDSIEIDPADCRYENERDALGWTFSVGWRFVKWKNGWEKAPFAWHESSRTSFCYPLGGADPRQTRVALFADFGTKLYHSAYIAKRIAARQPDYALHLGDVYYAGKRDEFEGHFRPMLAPVIAGGAQLFAMNANHEMLSGGHSYFAYLREKQALGQAQEGSYYCLQAERFNLVGIDTAYHRDGRLTERKLVDWLTTRLEEGRRRGAMNILLSPNEPFSVGNPLPTKLLTHDLAALVSRGLVDLWFWGNTHYCALFERSAGMPFIGSCIGHAGFPYDRYKDEAKAGTPTGVRFLETEARFPAWTNVRQDRGNAGFVQMTLDHQTGGVLLEYVDWMNRLRHAARIERGPAGLLFQG